MRQGRTREYALDWFHSDPLEWAQVHFGDTDLGDKRRTKRLVKVAALFSADPSGSIPRQSETWGDAKAAYRLFDQEDVTFQAVCQPHWNLRHRCGPGKFALISDTTDLDFGKHRRLKGAGPTGNGSGRGLLLHSTLLVDGQTKDLLCVAGAELWCRQPKRKKETSKQRLERTRESQRWGQVVERIGPAPAGAQWVHLMDREADNFEVFCHCQDQGTDWVIRARTLARGVLEGPQDKKAIAVRQVRGKWPVLQVYELEVPTKARTRREPARGARTARMELRVGRIWIPPPRQKSPALKARGCAPIAMAVVWAREIKPPKGEEAIDWMLYTSLPNTTLAEALEVLDWYKMRWTVEEWHKALKTGTQIKERQLETADRMAPLIGLSSIEALRLVQLKTLARAEPERSAEGVIPERYQEALKKAVRMSPTSRLTVRLFFRGVARLGGFLGRRGDGEPGWQTTWRGWEKLSLMVRGYELKGKAYLPEKCG